MDYENVLPSSKSWTAYEILTETELSLLQKILLGTDGTVTDLLMLYSGTQIYARKLSQALSDSLSERILYRKVVLESSSGVPFVYAESEFKFDLFPEKLQRDLMETETPIGSLWQRERLEMYREIIDRSAYISEETAALLQVPAQTLILRRTYCIYHDGKQMGKITENFASTMFL